jgi:ubiquinone/menaquinone biosynthesis C-methylase UbiE
MQTFIPSSAQKYEAWYASRRGAWIGDSEARLLMRLGNIGHATRVLDAGCGTGWFSRRYATAGAQVTGLDYRPDMIRYAHSLGGDINYTQGDMCALPFATRCFDTVSAVTSLCFVDDEITALKEMLRVARHTVVLGLLHRHSLLWWRKHDHGMYTGARWHTRRDIQRLLAQLPGVSHYEIRTILFWPGGPAPGRLLETIMPLARWFGGFMAVRIVLR